jgi:HK97 family phage major capsid protein
MDDLTVLGAELKDFTAGASKKIDELQARTLGIEQKLTAPRGFDTGNGGEDIGSTVIGSAEFKAFSGTNRRSSGPISVGSFHKSNLVNSTGLNQPLVQAFRKPGIISPGQQPLGIRNLIPSTPLSSNMVEYARETSSTNAAAIQVNEGDAKAESALTFALSYAPVRTIAHWIPVSRQLLDDAPAIQGYVNSRMLFFLKLKEDLELLSGSGTGTEISGLIANSTAFDTSVVTVATDTFLDILQLAITQCSRSYLPPDGIILNPLDFARIQRIKTTGSASSGEYIFADPHTVQQPRIWGLPIVTSWSMAESQFLVGAFAMAAMIWDKNDATVEISREHSDFFVRNMAALLCEERLALTVFRSDALVFGGFPFGS